MATNISIDFSKLHTVSTQAAALGRKMDATKDELIALQEQLRETQNYLEKRYDTCWDSVVPIKRLRKQSGKMDDVVSVLTITDNLAKDVENKLRARANMLKLFVSTTSFMFSTAMSVIAGNLTGETDCGNGWCGVGNQDPTPEEICAEMEARYQRTLEVTTRTSFSGACSAFVYRQLCDVGVFESGKDSGVAAGKDYYSVWSKKSTTSTGYSIESYGYDETAKNNPLQNLINAHHGETLENIVVSFNYDGKNYTNEKYGHVMLITAIKDGNVYYMESADGSLWNVNPNQTYKEGEPICLSVSDFMKQYPKMNGVVHFYK